ncbi:hypothetical protein [Thiothrix subterranea]|uniref:Uncharacterized protein n=1 Tax=Thiothrix subterranea TaxID=2735563 RepID=A0AA51QYZ8_9GAMM|nr:hypothetical protein [Thiothrix subterranea]MDQ5768822.1 hypothetical protein [Thiothrix subterranea]WML86497.1 hypothetical protein RCG00_19710 [Thiothrix subterranea]
MNRQLNLDAAKAVNEYVKVITEWNKLLVGLNVVMGGGCLTILQNSAAQGLTRTFLVLAIVAFVISTLFSVLLMGQALAMFTNISQLPTSEESPPTLDRWSNTIIKILTRLQLIAFILACLFLGIWVTLKLL